MPKGQSFRGAINKPSLTQQVSLIKKPEELHQGLLSFSFKYLELDNEKFGLPCPKAKGGYLQEFLQRTKGYCSMTASELQNSQGKTARCHKLAWEDTSESGGFSNLNEQLQQLTPWQISISTNNYGRVHGFFIDSTFYAVWIDHDHKLYPGKK